jgi:ATP-dependent 26S proteasome regulatory subunit
MSTTNNGRPGVADWYDAILADYQAGVAHGFLVHGAIHDYVEDPTQDLSVTDYLMLRLGSRFSVVAYSPDQGITFPGETSDLTTTQALAKAARERFEAATGLGQGELSDMERLALEASGAGSLGQAPGLPKEPNRAIPALIDFLANAYGGDPILEDGVIMGTDPGDAGDGTGMRALVIIERLDLIAPPADTGAMAAPDRATLAAFHRVGTTGTIQGNGGMLVMLAPSLASVHGELKATSTGLRSVEISPPNREQRIAYLERVAADRDLSFPDVPLAIIADGMAALGRRHIEDVALRAVTQTGGAMTSDLVNQRREELMQIEYDGILEAVDTSVTLDMVGGHTYAIEYLMKRVIGVVKSGDQELLRRLAMGILLAGPSGTGKTFLARALANALGWRMFYVRPENVKGKFMGESEQKLAKALNGVNANAPCLAFFDEVDQTIQRGGAGSSSVDSNMFGRILEWTSDTSMRGRRIVVAATNRPDELDAAFLRPGRFDIKLPLLVPQDAQERREMLVKLMKRAGLAGWDSPQVLTVADKTDGWTPAELENLVNEAALTSMLEEISVPEALVDARDSLRAATRDVEAMTLLALSICDNVKMVPPKFRDAVAEKPAEKEAAAVRASGPRGRRDLKL